MAELITQTRLKVLSHASSAPRHVFEEPALLLPQLHLLQKLIDELK